MPTTIALRRRPDTGSTQLVLMASLLLVGVGAFAEEEAVAEEEPKRGWSAEAELSYVLAAGNSEANTLGLKAKVQHDWEKAQLTLKASGLRAETATSSRYAVGDSDDWQLVEESLKELTAQNHHLDGAFDRRVSKRFFWKVSGSWERDRFAGIENRALGVLGFGNTLLDRERVKLEASYGLSLTHQVDVDEAAGSDRTFVGFQLAWELEVGIGESGRYTNALSFDDNLEEIEDYRVDWVNGLRVALDERLALQASLQWLYRNRPALTSVSLVSPGGEGLGEVLVPLSKLDTRFTTSLVLTF